MEPTAQAGSFLKGLTSTVASLALAPILVPVMLLVAGFTAIFAPLFMPLVIANGIIDARHARD